MFDIVDATEPFARLAAATGAVPDADPLAELGPMPGWVRQFLPQASNADLSSGVTNPSLSIADVRSACLAIPPARYLSRGDWRDWTCSLACAASEHPEHADELREIMHAASSREGAYDLRGAFANGYNRAANDAEWEGMLAATEQRMTAGKDVRTLGSLFHEAKAHGWMPGVDPQPSTVNDPRPVLGRMFGGSALGALLPSDTSSTTPIFDIEISRAINRFGSSYKRLLELGGWLFMGELTSIYGPGARGKTTLLVLLVLALVTGKNLLGMQIFLKRTVLILNFEETVAEQILKIEAAAKHHCIRKSELSDLHVFGSDTAPSMTMVTINPVSRQPQVNAAFFGWLEWVIDAIGAEVVSLDPYSALMPYGMNDNGLTYAVAAALKAVARKHNCAIIVSAHTRKSSRGAGGGDSVDDVMGAAALTNASRVALAINGVDMETAKAIGIDYGEEGDFREVVSTKANFTRIGGGKYFRLTAVTMPNAVPPYSQGDEVAVAELYTPIFGKRSIPLAGMRDAAVQIARGARGGAEPYCQKSGTPRCFGPDIAAALQPHMPALKPPALEKAAKELVIEGMRDGWIVTKTFTNAHRKVATGLEVVWSATAWAGDPKPPGAYVS